MSMQAVKKEAQELAQAETARGLRDGTLTDETCGAFEKKRALEIASKLAFARLLALI